MSINIQKLIDLTGAMPLKNINNAEIVIDNFCSNDMAVITTNRSTNIAHGTHFHNSYEFIVTYSKMPSCIVNNKIYNISENKLLAINPMQEHGLQADIEGFNLLGIHINKDFVQNIASNIYGLPNIVFSNESFSVEHDISLLIRLFMEELKYKQLGHSFIEENLSILITASLFRQIKHNLIPKPHNKPTGNKKTLTKAIDYMNENYSSDISCTELADLVKMDKYSFIRSFKAQTNKTPIEYFLDLKIEKAKKMLKSNDYSITEISLNCGFSSHSHFTSTFKKRIGISPTEYKKNC